MAQSSVPHHCTVVQDLEEQGKVDGNEYVSDQEEGQGNRGVP